MTYFMTKRMSFDDTDLVRGIVKTANEAALYAFQLISGKRYSPR